MTDRPTAAPVRDNAASGRGATIALLLAALLMSGCSFSWDSAGIKDVILGGRHPADIVAAGQPPPPASTETNADAAATNADTGGIPVVKKGEPEKKPEEPEPDEKHALRKIAVLPVAYIDASGGQPCDLCPPSVQMKQTSALSARLVTGFIYEDIARHPRFLFPTPETVEKAMSASPARSMRETAARLAAAGRADVVVAAALIELRQREGPDDAPTRPAGVALYMSLVEARTGKVIWSDTFDRDESGRGMFLHAYDRLMNDKPIRWSTADGYSEHAVDKLVDHLVGEVD